MFSVIYFMPFGLSSSRFSHKGDVYLVPVTPGLPPGYELGTTERGGNRGGIADKAYDWL